MKSFYSADYDQLVTHCERAYPPGSAPHELTLALANPDGVCDLKDIILDLEAEVSRLQTEVSELEKPSF